MQGDNFSKVGEEKEDFNTNALKRMLDIMEAENARREENPEEIKETDEAHNRKIREQYYIMRWWVVITSAVVPVIVLAIVIYVILRMPPEDLGIVHGVLISGVFISFTGLYAAMLHGLFKPWKEPSDKEDDDKEYKKIRDEYMALLKKVIDENKKD